MALYITPQEDVDAYFNSPNLSQSKLKLLLGGMDSYLKDSDKKETELYYKENKSFLIGSAVDCILTGEKDTFEKLYHVSELEEKPSDAEKSLVNEVVDILIEHDKLANVQDFGQTRHYLNIAIENQQWFKGKPGEVRIGKLIEKCEGYFQDLKKAFGKQVLSKEEKELIDRIVRCFKTSPTTSDLFSKSTIKEVENHDVYYQLPIYFKYRGLDCKALLDIVLVKKDSDGNIISIKIIDIKTMAGNVLNFPNSVRTWRYDIQGAWYREALRHWSKNTNNIYVDEIYFIVVSSTNPTEAVSFQCDPELMKIGKHGLPEMNFRTPDENRRVYKPEIKGFEKLLDDYEFYERTQWSREREIEENNGLFKLSWDRRY